MSRIARGHPSVGVSDRWANLGAKATVAPPIEKTNWVISGPTKVGKSHLIQSDPTAVVFDFDSGGGSSPDVQSFVCPDPGSDQTMTWELFETLMRTLEEDRESENRFRRVVIDSFDVFLTMLINQMTSDYNAKQRDPNRRIESMTEYGQAGKGWDRIASKAIFYLSKINQLGYAWTITTHLQEKVTTIKTGNELSMVTELKPTLPPKCMYYIRRIAHYQLRVERRTVREHELINRGGREIPDINNPTYKSVFSLRSDSDRIDGVESLFGMRIAMDLPIELPEFNGWEAVRKVYQDGCDRLLEKANSNSDNGN